MSFFRRRVKLFQRPVPESWLSYLWEIPLWRFLPEADQRELCGHVQVFLAEKKFEAAAGFSLNERVRVMIAGNACLLLLHRKADYFPFMRTVVVYPTLYVARYTRPGPVGTVEEGVEVRAGESWPLGTVVLAWDAVAAAGFGPGQRNVVVHEFAHQLDLEDGAMQGIPVLPPELRSAWAEVFFSEHQAGIPSPAEFFAVSVELFFSDPWALSPTVYALLSRYFCQDPLRFVPSA